MQVIILGSKDNFIKSNSAIIGYDVFTASYHTGADEDFGKSDRAMMRQLPPEEREKIQMQVADFLADKAKLDHEVAKWDDSGNDIIVMAKQMCMIMMEMTDFTRSVYHSQ